MPLTNVVVTGKVALALPAGTVTLAGTLAAVLALFKVTLVAADTAELKVTMPCDEEPAGTVDGLSETAVSDGPAGGGGGVPDGLTVSVADWVTPAPETEITTLVGVLTSVVKMSNPPLVVPAGMMTKLLIRAMDGSLLAIGSARSEVGAEARLTVANEPEEPLVVVGLNVND